MAKWTRGADETTPLDETLGAFAALIQQGKVRAIGTSNYTAERLAAAKRVSRDHGLPAYVRWLAMCPPSG